MSVGEPGPADAGPVAAEAGLDDPAATLERIRHELANVSLSIDALATAVAAGSTDDATVVRVLETCCRRINAIRDW